MDNKTNGRRKHKAPAGSTGQEALYLRSLSERRATITIQLRDSETVTGWIEYFDDQMIRLTRDGQPNLFIYKTHILSITEQTKRAPTGKRSNETTSA